MSFGKKKSVLPRVAKKSSVRATSRIVPVSNHQPSGCDQVIPDLDADQTLSMADIGVLAAGICEARGYPDDLLPAVAIYNVWLSQRGLPALSNMSKHMLSLWQEDLKGHGPRAGPQGDMIVRCPLFGSGFMGGFIDQLVAAGPGKKINFTSEGPMFLMLPRLSDHAQRHNVTLMVEIFSTTHSEAHTTSFILRGDDLAIYPGQVSMSKPTEVIIRVVPPEHIPSDLASQILRPDRRTQDIQVAMIDLINGARKSKRLPSITPGLPPAPQPNGVAPLKAETRQFFQRVIADNPQLVTLLRGLSKGDKSMVEAIVFGKTEDQADLSKSILMTSAGSNNDRFWSYCMNLGWMTESHDNPTAQYGGKAYQVTKTGLMGLSVLLLR